MGEPMRIADVRDRLTRFLAEQPKVETESECPMCKGTGRVVRAAKAWRQEDVAKVIGVTRTTVVGFLSGKQGLTFDAAHVLIAWLDEREAEAAAYHTEPGETPDE